MLIYWLLFAFPAAASLLAVRNASEEARPNPLALLFFWLFYNLVSALRFEVGGDWSNYNMMVEAISHESLEFALGYGDLAFNFMAWLFIHAGLGLPGINALCSMILSAGVIVMARRTPAPWLAITAAVPYLLIVVGLGYIRQAAAIGFILLAISAFTERKNVPAAIYMVLATLFHAAAIVGGVAASYALSQSRVEAFQAGYIEAGYDSAGTLVRLVMNLLPAAILLWRRKAMGLNAIEQAIWTWMAIACGLAMAAFFVSPSSTAVDRIALFFSPIQVFVFGYTLRALQRRGPLATALVLALIGYFAATQLVWLVWASHAEYWVPYRSLFDAMPEASR